MMMSEPQLISPLLDGFVMGDPISNHDGVQCCPAMQLETDKKYIVKIVSVPASQSKLDALLLAGAFTDRESALSYFRDLADNVLEEAALLQRLSRFEGFVSYDSWQLEEMGDEETGYDIYLLGDYRLTLAEMLRDNTLTNLDAVNLGLDLCTALSAARRSGYLYVNLRPSNIHICKDHEFRIADLGFISLPSLPYASLPDKYHSDYTPPEISDAFSSLNDTMDTYAVGLILYQAYNGGLLPPIGMPLATPQYADFALSEIILKACSLNPEERWQDPVQMGQALINYLQSNSVNDTPIVPETVEESEIAEEPAQDSDEPSTDEILAEVDEALENAPEIIVAEPAANDAEDTDEAAPVQETAESSEEEPCDAQSEEASAESQADEEEAQAEEEDTQPDEEISDSEPSSEPENDDETSQMLAQADDLIAHKLPDPVVAPEAIEVTLPVADEPAEEAEVAEEEEAPADEASEATAAEAEEIMESSVEESEESATPKKSKKGLIAALVSLSAALLLIVGGFLFYQNYYLQTVYDIILSSSEEVLTVKLETDIADEKLTVSCTDTYGNKLEQPVIDGVATFTNLKPSTNYKLEVSISGFHKLLGQTTDSYTTATPTQISGFYAATGPEDGSVILSFTVQGPKPEQWIVHYAAQDEEEKTVTFAGQLVTLTGLTVGKEYTFTLEPVTQLYLKGTVTISYTPSQIIYAENVQIHGFKNNVLHVTWATPEGMTVNSWSIRCYNENGYDKTLTTAENAISFEDLDITAGYTVEVTAEGMTMGVRSYLSANSITIQDIQFDASNRNQLAVSWSYEGTAPEGGWLLLYTVDSSGEQQVVACTENKGTIKPLIPGGHYSIVIKPANGGTVFNGEAEFDAPAAPTFQAFSFKAEDMKLSMCLTPQKEGWDKNDVSKKNYKTAFKVGESASFVMRLNKNSGETDDDVTTLYVIRDSQGKLVSNKYETRTWDQMWYKKDGKLTIPFMPEQIGTYTVEIYFNGEAVTTQSFEITA